MKPSTSTAIFFSRALRLLEPWEQPGRVEKGRGGGAVFRSPENCPDDGSELEASKSSEDVKSLTLELEEDETRHGGAGAIEEGG